MITDISPIDPKSLLIIINTIYFKAKWEDPFDVKDTIHNPFFINGNQQTECEFMRLEDVSVITLKINKIKYWVKNMITIL